MRNRDTTRKRYARGFTLAELVIVLMIVLVLAALAIPNLLRARDTANEAAAEGALRTITIGQITYYALYQGYAPSLQALGPPQKGALPSADAADFIDSQLAAGFKSGYRFGYSVVDLNGDGFADGFVVNADPENGGRNSLFMDQTGVIRNKQLSNSLDSFKTGAAGGGVPRE